jgi:acylphosphatase
MSEAIKCSVVVRGRVQGVGFRAATRRFARKNDVCGWVRNSDNGSVEALLVGTKTQVDNVLEFLNRGPRFARVDSCEHELLSILPGEMLPNDFTIPQTA